MAINVTDREEREERKNNDMKVVSHHITFYE